MKHVFIINPVSGTGTYKKLIPTIESYFASGEYQIIMTEYVGHASEIAAKYSIKDDVCLYAVGGDGTAYEVLNGLKDGVMMSVIPAGTGNDYYRSISGNQKISDVKKILLETIEGKVVNVDYGVANAHRFLNCCCMGLDAEIVEYTNNVIKRTIIPKSIAYIAAALKKVIRPKKIQCTIHADNETISMEAVLIAIMNGKYYGGGFTPAPNANIQDKHFDAVMVDYLPTHRIIPLLPVYFSGKHENVKEVTFKTLDSFEFQSLQPVTYCCDGEIFKDDHIIFRLMKAGLRLRVPKESVLQ